ncbi:MAG: LytR C-terminal domain-containing protein [Gemmatimonadota bacterium]
MTRQRMLMFAGGAVAVLALGVFAARQVFARGGPAALLGDTTSAPQGQRVIVEVLNSSGVPGLARRATFLLRDRGFDVIGWGNDPQGRRSETLIVDYTDKPEAADRLARVLGGAQVERGKDSLDRGLDLTVRLGSGYKPPVEAFHP